MAYKLVQVSVTLILLAVTFSGSGCKKGAGQKKIDKALKIMNKDKWCDKDVKAALGDGGKPMDPTDFIEIVRKAFADDAGKAKKDYGKREDVNKKLKEFTKKWNKQEKDDKLDAWTDIKEKNTTKNKEVKGKDTDKGKDEGTDKGKDEGTDKGKDKGKTKAGKDGDGGDAGPDAGKDNCGDHFKENAEDDAPSGDDSPPVSTTDSTDTGDHFKENEDESESEDDALPVSTTVSSDAEDHFKENESEAEDDALPVSTTVSSEAGAPKPPSLNAVHLRIGN